MAKKFICGGEKYELGGPLLDTIVLPVKSEGWPTVFEIEGYTLTLKTKFHVSLVAVGQIIKKHGVTEANFLEDVVNFFCEYVQKHPVELVRYKNEFRFVSENERRAVVVMCDVVNIDQFFDLLSVRYNLRLQHPPTHVTLYTLQPDVGIFLTDFHDMEKLTKLLVPAPIKL